MNYGENLKKRLFRAEKIMTSTHERNSLACFPDELKLDFSQNDEVEEEFFYEDDESPFCYEDNELSAILQPAENLPEGFFWRIWDDGSGHLLYLDGTESFAFDLAPYCLSGGVEFAQNSKDREWNVFWGAKNEFMEFAEWETAETLRLALEK